MNEPHGERVEVDEAENGEYFWRYIAANGEEISRSSETYANRQHAIEQAEELNPGLKIYVRNEALGWSQVDREATLNQAVDLLGSTGGEADASQNEEDR